jgi:hypothetical protein
VIELAFIVVQSEEQRTDLGLFVEIPKSADSIASIGLYFLLIGNAMHFF